MLTNIFNQQTNKDIYDNATNYIDNRFGLGKLDLTTPSTTQPTSTGFNFGDAFNKYGEGIMGAGQLGLGVLDFFEKRKNNKLLRKGLKQDLEANTLKLDTYKQNLKDEKEFAKRRKANPNTGAQKIVPLKG